MKQTWYWLIPSCCIAGILMTLGAMPENAPLPPNKLSAIMWLALSAATSMVLIFLVQLRAGRRMAEADMEKDAYMAALRHHTIMTMSSPDARITDMNAKFLQAFDMTREQALGTPSHQLYEHGTDDPVYKAVRETIFKGVPWSGEHRFRTAAGELRTLLLTIVPLYDKAGRYLRNVSLRTDVTAVRQQEAQRRLTDVLEELPDQVYVFSTDAGRLMYANHTARGWLNEDAGWEGEDYLGHTVHDLGGRFDLEGFRDRVVALHKGEARSVVFRSEYQGQPLELNLQLLDAGVFGTACYVAVVRDLTARMEAENAKREIVSVVSHELRSPLTSIRGSLRLLTSGVAGDLGANATSVLKIAERNTERMLLVVNDMLDLQKIEAGKMDFTLDDTDLVDLLTSSIEECTGYGDEFGVSLRLEMPGGDAKVRGNIHRLTQVMTNLLSNAVKFSSRGSEVVVRLRRIDADWRIEVADHGPGIAPEDRQRVFERFAMARPTDGVERKGSGLGLHIVKTIVERHGGRIDLTSEVGKGTTFYFDLPALDADMAELVQAAE